MAKKELFSDVDELVSSLNKELGEGSIMNFGDDRPIISIPRESTGSLVVDKALGGGWAVGRIHELVGMESCGKTMMCTLSMIEFQKKHISAHSTRPTMYVLSVIWLNTSYASKNKHKTISATIYLSGIKPT